MSYSCITSDPRIIRSLPETHYCQYHQVIALRCHNVVSTLLVYDNLNKPDTIYDG